MKTFMDTIGSMPDPRDSNSSYKLSHILFIAIAAVLCGVRSCAGFAYFALHRRAFLDRFIDLPARSPSHDVFSDILRRLDKVELAERLRRFMNAIAHHGEVERRRRHLAMDGKAMKRAYAKGEAHLPAFVATIYDCDRCLTLALASAREKGGEAAAALQALRLLALDGAVVTGDALYATHDVTEVIRKNRGHYCLGLKGNSPLAYEAGQAAVAAALRRKPGDIHVEEDRGHGRIETRRAFVVACAAARNAKGEETLVGMKAVGVIEATRTVTKRLHVDGKPVLRPETVTSRRLYALSFKPKAKVFAALARNHWRIENRQHWQLDVVFREDEARNREDDAAPNLAVLRRIAQNCLSMNAERVSGPLKMQRAAHDEEFLIALMTQKR